MQYFLLVSFCPLFFLFFLFFTSSQFLHLSSGWHQVLAARNIPSRKNEQEEKVTKDEMLCKSENAS